MSYKRIVIHLLLLPIVYAIWLFELNILTEVCPMSVNILLYLFIACLISIVSVYLAYLQYSACHLITFISYESEYIIYSSFLCNCTLILYIVYLILPGWIFAEFAWLNFRILYLMFFPNIVIYSLWNAITKNRGNMTFSPCDIAITWELALFFLFKDPLYLAIRNSTSKVIYIYLIVGLLARIFASFQAVLGSRFFFPNKYRTKKLEYRRIITEDFKLSTLDESLWPEWDSWMQKLHHSSLYAGDKNLKDIEGENCYQMYMRTLDGKKLHYFWLLNMLEQNSIQQGIIHKIDEYDD